MSMACSSESRRQPRQASTAVRVLFRPGACPGRMTARPFRSSNGMHDEPRKSEVHTSVQSPPSMAKAGVHGMGMKGDALMRNPDFSCPVRE